MPEGPVSTPPNVDPQSWENLTHAIDIEDSLQRALTPLRGQQEPQAVDAIRAALGVLNYRRKALDLLGNLPPSTTEALVDALVRVAITMAETHRVRYLLGRLRYSKAEELVSPAIWRLLEAEDANPNSGPVYDVWFRMAELLRHLGLFSALAELVEKSRDHIEGDVRELAEYFEDDLR